MILGTCWGLELVLRKGRENSSDETTVSGIGWSPLFWGRVRFYHARVAAPELSDLEEKPVHPTRRRGTRAVAFWKALSLVDSQQLVPNYVGHRVLIAVYKYSSLR